MGVFTGQQNIKRLSEVSPAISAGQLGERFRLISLAAPISAELRDLGRYLNLDPYIFHYSTINSFTGELLGLVSTISDYCWFSENSKQYPATRLHELVITARNIGLRNIKSIPEEMLFKNDPKGLSILLALDKEVAKEELVGVIELLLSCRAKKIIPITAAYSLEYLSLLTEKCEQVLLT